MVFGTVVSMTHKRNRYTVIHIQIVLQINAYPHYMQATSVLKLCVCIQAGYHLHLNCFPNQWITIHKWAMTTLKSYATGSFIAGLSHAAYAVVKGSMFRGGSCFNALGLSSETLNANLIFEIIFWK